MRVPRMFHRVTERKIFTAEKEEDAEKTR